MIKIFKLTKVVEILPESAEKTLRSQILASHLATRAIRDNPICRHYLRKYGMMPTLTPLCQKAQKND